MHEAVLFLVKAGFKVHRAFEAEGAVEPLAVVKDFDPFKDGGSRVRFVVSSSQTVERGPAEQ